MAAKWQRVIANTNWTWWECNMLMQGLFILSLIQWFAQNDSPPNPINFDLFCRARGHISVEKKCNEHHKEDRLTLWPGAALAFVWWPFVVRRNERTGGWTWVRFLRIGVADFPASPAPRCEARRWMWEAPASLVALRAPRSARVVTDSGPAMRLPA